MTGWDEDLKRNFDTFGFCETLDEIAFDHRDGEGPFEGLKPPEQIALEEIDDPEIALRFLTFGCALDYARPADRHWETMLDIAQEMSWAYDPYIASRVGEGVLEMCFASSGIRFWGNDSDTWHTIATSLADNYDGWVTHFLDSVDWDAEKLVDHLQDSSTEPYPYLQGDKIAPMYAIMIDEYVRELSNMDTVSIPVDVQIEKVTVSMIPEFGQGEQEFRRRRIREFWSEIAERHGISLYRIDEALWQIGRFWDEWGKEYLQQKVWDVDADFTIRDPVITDE